MGQIALIFLLYEQDIYKWSPESAGAPLLSNGSKVKPIAAEAERSSETAACSEGQIPSGFGYLH
jgi:hypothetical protein